MPNIEIPGIQGLFESIIYAKGGQPLTVKEAALYYAMGMGMPITVGTPSDIVDKMEYYMDEGGADGFMLVATYTPGCFEEFVDLVVPELQRRGRYRTAYSRVRRRVSCTVLKTSRVGDCSAEFNSSARQRRTCLTR